jgi:hypothetical protein
MRKWANDVSTVLNANIYGHVNITQECYEGSLLLHSGTMSTHEWLETVE